MTATQSNNSFKNSSSPYPSNAILIEFHFPPVVPPHTLISSTFHTPSTLVCFKLQSLTRSTDVFQVLGVCRVSTYISCGPSIQKDLKPDQHCFSEPTLPNYIQWYREIEIWRPLSHRVPAIYKKSLITLLLFYWIFGPQQLCILSKQLLLVWRKPYVLTGKSKASIFTHSPSTIEICIATNRR